MSFIATALCNVIVIITLLVMLLLFAIGLSHLPESVTHILGEGFVVFVVPVAVVMLMAWLFKPR